MNVNPAENRLVNNLQAIRQGDQQIRTDFLEEYKPFVSKTASALCKRYLEWGKDDELSIGLIALNSALDLFRPEKGVPFLPFAKLVIESRIKDYFKQESRHQHFSLDTSANTEVNEYISPAELEQAWTAFQSKTIEDERQLEIEILDKMLHNYGISFDDLVVVSTKHKDTRANLIRVAACLAKEDKLMQHLQQKRQLPVKELVLISGISRKTLENGRKYIIALALILYHSEEFIYLRSYIALDEFGKEGL